MTLQPGHAEPPSGGEVMWQFNFGDGEDDGQAHQAGPPPERGMQKLSTDGRAFWRDENTGKYKAIPEGYTLPPVRKACRLVDLGYTQ
jgi:hypothetical protein